MSFAIGKGHPDVMNYPHSFFSVTLSEINKADRENIINMAMAHKGSKFEDFEEFSDMIRDIDEPKEVDHSANLKLLSGGFGS